VPVLPSQLDHDDRPALTAGAQPRSWSAVLTGAAFWLCLAGVAALALVRERDQAVEHAEQSAAATVALLEQHTVATFRAVDVALEETANRLAAGAAPRNDPAVREAMKLHLRDMPFVRALFVIGPDGFIQHDTDYPKTPDGSLADRGYFKVHQANPQLVAHMSDPLQSRAGLGWFVAVTRRIPGDGEFKGIVVAAIQLRYFGDLYTRMGLTQGQRIALFHRDGRLLAQYPTDDGAIGKTYAEFPLFKTYVSKSGSGTYISSGPPVLVERILSYRVVDKQPLVVLVSHELAAVLAPWWRTVYGAAAALGVLLLVMAAAIALRLRTEAERERAQARMAQGEKLEALGRLTGSIAHDFNNVLGIIANSLSLINALPEGKDEKVRAAIGTGRKAVATGGRLTRDLLSFARQRELRLAPADLSEAVAQMRPILEQAAGPRTTLETMLATGLRRCELDYTQLQVTLINLVVNARDAMGGAGTVGITTANVDRVEPGGWRVWLLRRRTTPWVSLTVSDTGAGMSEEVAKRALEPFFTTKGEQGTGLGLAQVYGFMNQLDGDVRIESAPGRGTQVHLYFRALA
jgi:two-component system NtrC family sensor kinase